MSILVVYDSWFGNTARVAQAIANGIEPLADVRVLSAVEAPSRFPGAPQISESSGNFLWAQIRAAVAKVCS